MPKRKRKRGDSDIIDLSEYFGVPHRIDKSELDRFEPKSGGFAIPQPAKARPARKKSTPKARGKRT